MHGQLVAAYGPQSWWPAQTSFEVILGAYLTQNTAWKAVERSLDNLRSAGALTLPGLRSISVAQLQELIRPSGFATRKAPAIKAFVGMLDGEFAGSLDALAAEPTLKLRVRLLDLPGVGPETADAIMLYALGHAVPVADEEVAGAGWLPATPPLLELYLLHPASTAAHAAPAQASRVRRLDAGTLGSGTLGSGIRKTPQRLMPNVEKNQ